MLRESKAGKTAILVVCKAALGVVLLTAPLARGEELVTLRSGFTITCTSREAISTATVRLYLPGELTASANYMDVPISSVTAIDIAPATVAANHNENAVADTVNARFSA